MYTYNAKLDRVVDGDTVDALVDLGFDTWKKVRIRLHGLDAWESRTRDFWSVTEFWLSFSSVTTKVDFLRWLYGFWWF